MEEFILLVEVSACLAGIVGILYGLYKYFEWLINKKLEEAKAYRAVMDAKLEDSMMQKKIMKEVCMDVHDFKLPDLPLDSMESYREAIKQEIRRRIYEAGSFPDEELIQKEFRRLFSGI